MMRRGPSDGDFSLLDLAQHEFAICNACRYCEAYCAVFPAMERRDLIAEGDLAYLAHLCHDCRACVQACMYAEPHEFAIDIPGLLTDARTRSYASNAWPRALGRAFERGPLTLLAVNAVTLLILLALVELIGPLGPLFRVSKGPGAFYDVISHLAMIGPALLLTAYGVAVVGAGVVWFWRQAGGRASELASVGLWVTAVREVAALRWMRGGGAECYYPDDEQPSRGRRVLHQLTAYGFVASFLATVSAFVEEAFFGVVPPYAALSVPVALGFVGGLGVIVGCLGLIRLKVLYARRSGAQGAPAMDSAFLLALLLVAGTGMMLLLLRDTALVRLMLIVHLGTVGAFYLTAPYGKFVHGVYRFVAVLRSVQEREDQGDVPEVRPEIVEVIPAAEPTR
jgi:citrate/tricarballylate utilization protein